MMRGLLLLVFAAPGLWAQWDGVVQNLESMIEAERAQKQIPTIGVALVDDQRVVFSRIFGEGGSRLFRAGSVSKLFTDVAVMRLVEQGKLDLDAPVTKYIPEFQPRNPFGVAITLRQLTSHRSGLVREPPVGHYFDNTNVTLAATVRSLNGTELVYEPGKRTKYSNAGIAVVGYVLERMTGRAFEPALRADVLEPLGMKESGFSLREEWKPLLAKAWMWTYDNRRFPAPQFELGMAPAGSLYTTVEDLGKFAACLFRGGAPVVREETLEKMWTPQFGGTFGLGFGLSRMDGERVVSHGGAIYGFATDFRAVVGEKLAVVVFVNLDSANTVGSRISQQALRWMRQARRGEKLEARQQTVALTDEELGRYAGVYGEGDAQIELTRRDANLYLTPAGSGTRLALRRMGEDLVTDDLHGFGMRLRPRETGMQNGPNLLVKQGRQKPAECPQELRKYVGEYGWDHDVLYILERGGKLFTLIEWYDYYPLTMVKPGVFRFPQGGLYDGELLTFSEQGAQVGGVLFPRRRSGSTDGVFRLTPVRPVGTLRKEALRAKPPVETGDFLKSELTELQSLDATIRLDIRYASKDNFLSTPVYSQARAFLQRPAAEGVVRAQRRLKEYGYGLWIHDGYRPWYVTKIFWEATPADKHDFVADPEKGSRHNRGCAVDLTLYDLKTGKPVEMTGLYDEMSDRSFPDYPGGTSLARWQRELLRETMEREGFHVFDVEWWHFDYKDWQRYRIENVTYESMRRKK